jgi:hypothetical protein
VPRNARACLHRPSRSGRLLITCAATRQTSTCPLHYYPQQWLELDLELELGQVQADFTADMHST